jgi:hypothetical protein
MEPTGLFGEQYRPNSTLRSGIFAVLQTDTAENTDLFIADVPDLPADATITNVTFAAVART